MTTDRTGGRRCGHRRAHALALWATLGAVLAPSPLEGQPERPPGARRQVRVFDFEERNVNFEDVPMHWFRVVDDGSAPDAGRPAWNRAGFDSRVRYSGAWSVRLPTKGGGTLLRLGPGVAPAIPGASYVITAKARTEGLTHARARLVARLLDARREPVPGSEARGPLLQTAGRWGDTSVHIPGDFAGAAWIQIDLELVQPSRAPGGARGLVFEDVRGGAWFDDVVVQQLPRVELRTESPGNVVVAPEEPAIVTTVHDLTGESLRGRIELRDLAGGLEASHDFDVAWGGRPTTWKPPLTKFGWRRATLEVASAEGVVSRSTLDFVYAPEPDRTDLAEAGRFELVLTDLRSARERNLGEVVRRAQTGAVRAPIWSALSAPVEDTPRAVEELASFIEPLLDRRQHVTFTLGDGPDPGAERAAAELLADSASEWTARMEPLLTRFGQRVRRWQMGATSSDLAPFRPRAVNEAERLEQSLAQLAPEPTVLLPWPAEVALSAHAASGGVTLDVPYSFHPDGLSALARTWPQGADVTMVLQPQPASLVGRRGSVIDLVRRTVEAWRLQPRAIAFRQPWSFAETATEIAGGEEGARASGGRPAPAMPTPEFAIVRQLVERLADRRIVAQAPAADGVVAYVLEGPGPDAIVAWNERAQPENAVIRAYLTEGPVRVHDMFGNARTVEMSGGLHEVKVGVEPVFIEGVDVELARFRAMVRVEPAFVPSTAERHELRVVLDNPWPVSLSGKMRVAEPAHWKITPRVQSFTIGPGKSEGLRFEASFGVAEEAGAAQMELELELSADRQYPPIRIRPALEIGLPYVQLTPSYRIERSEAGESDVVVTLVITNVGERPLTMQAFALAPGFAREQAPVSDLAPAESSVKRFHFKGGAAKLKGGSIRVGLIETDGLGRLNRTIRVE